MSYGENEARPCWFSVQYKVAELLVSIGNVIEFIGSRKKMGFVENKKEKSSVSRYQSCK
jgi:hypothetical protein